MKAIGVTRYGGPQVLQTVELIEPHAGPGRIRVRVHAAGVNPADVMLRDGSLAAAYAGLEPPFVPGMDVAGVVDEIGEDVASSFALELGQAVTAVVDNHGDRGGYSEYVVIPAESATAAPSGASFPEAASFLMNALTARHALDTLALPAGSRVLITGAAGGVGASAIALAAADGLTPIAVGRVEDTDLFLSLGATGLVPRGASVPAQVRAIVPAGVDAVIDAGSLGDAVVPAIRTGGTLIELRSGREEPVPGIRALFINVRDRVTDHAAIVRLREQVEEGLLPLRVAGVHPAAEAAAAHLRLEQGHLRGRLILAFGDPA